MDRPVNLSDLYRQNRTLPNGGPRLFVLLVEGSWTVSDGHRHYGKFSRKQLAFAVLRTAGFHSHPYGTGPYAGRDIYWHTF